MSGLVKNIQMRVRATSRWNRERTFKRVLRNDERTRSATQQISNIFHQLLVRSFNQQVRTVGADTHHRLAAAENPCGAG